MTVSDVPRHKCHRCPETPHSKFFEHKLTFGGQAVDGSRWILVRVILAIFILATVLPRLREGA